MNGSSLTVQYIYIYIYLIYLCLMLSVSLSCLFWFACTIYIYIYIRLIYVCLMLSVSLSCLFWFASSDFSNVYVVKTMCFAGCIDNHPSCHDWSAQGECSRNPAYMLVSCKKSCRKCSGKLCLKTFIIFCKI
jgi:hypothetical protein